MKLLELIVAPCLAAILLAGCSGMPPTPNLGYFALLIGTVSFFGVVIHHFIRKERELQKHLRSLEMNYLSYRERTHERRLEQIRHTEVVEALIATRPEPDTPVIELDPKRQIHLE